MNRCDTCGKNLDQMEVQSVQTDNGDLCLTCAGREIDRLHKLEADQRWRRWPEEMPEDNAEYWVMKSDPLNDNGKLYGCVMEGWEIAEHSDKSWKAGLVLYFRPIGELPT